MRYALAILCPPLAVLSCGRFFGSILNMFLCIFWFPAVIHALLVVRQYHTQNMHSEHMDQLRKERELIVENIRATQLRTMYEMARDGNLKSDVPRHLRKRKKKGKTLKIMA
jgi:uncharacterized membrane protein YqaE (UPF0057 family)